MGSRVVLPPGRVPLRQPGSCLFSPQGAVPLLERHVLAAPFVSGVCSAKFQLQCICLLCRRCVERHRGFPLSPGFWQISDTGSSSCSHSGHGAPSSKHPRGALTGAVYFYAQQSLAPATRRLYAVGQHHYHTFCNMHQRRPLPATEMQLAEFVTYLVDRVKVPPVTIKTYMAAVRSLHVEQGIGDPLAGTTLPHHVFTGVKRVHSTGQRLIHLPITLAVLRRIIYKLQRASWLLHIDQLMVGAACSLAFFGFMRYGELLGLQFGDVVIRHEPTKHFVASLRASKTNPFRQGCSVSVGSVNNSNAPLCTVHLIEVYQRASAPTMAGANHPFFKYKNGEALSRAHLTRWYSGCWKETGALTPRPSRDTASGVEQRQRLPKQECPTG